MIKVKKKPDFDRTVHILHNGYALCGMPGTPNTWPSGHTFVTVSGYKSATHDACKFAAIRQGLVEETQPKKRSKQDG